MSVQGTLPMWDSSRVFPGPGSVEIDDAFAAVSTRAGRLAREVSGQVGSLSGGSLLKALREYEDCVSDLQRLSAYAELVFALHDQGPAVTSLLYRCDAAWGELEELLGFFESELATHKSLADKELGPYAHFVDKIRSAAAGTASPEREEVLAALLPTGAEGWQRLAQQLLSRIEVTGPGGESWSIGRAMPDLYRSDRGVRERTHAAISTALEAEIDLRATALGMIAADDAARARLRSAHWLQSRLETDQIGSGELSDLLAAADESLPIVHEYYDFKRTHLGTGRLYDYDRYAPLYPVDPEISWDEAVDIALAGAESISAQFGALARAVVQENCIDASPRAGKQRSAFTRAIPGHLPCVSMNFTGRLRDVLVLAHELGHAVHMRSAAVQPLFAAVPAPVLAETVALFCEAVALRTLLERSTDDRVRATLLARRLEDQMTAVGRHAALHRFETGLREEPQTDGPPAAERIGTLWLEGQRRLYGPAVELTEGYRMWWSYLGDLFTSPGSHYSYIYGQLSALALLSRFEQDPAAFAVSFHELLRAGDTHPPGALLARLGLRPGGSADWAAAAGSWREQLVRLRSLTGGTPADFRPAQAADGKSTPSGREEELT